MVATSPPQVMSGTWSGPGCSGWTLPRTAAVSGFASTGDGLPAARARLPAAPTTARATSTRRTIRRLMPTPITRDWDVPLAEHLPLRATRVAPVRGPRYRPGMATALGRTPHALPNQSAFTELYAF